MESTTERKLQPENRTIQALEQACRTLRDELQAVQDKNKKAIEMLEYRKSRAAGKVIEFYNRLTDTLK